VSRTILIIDDDPDIRSALADVLLSECFAVREAGNGREALQLVLGGIRPSLILLDLMMPLMNGWEFLAEARRHRQLAAVPVVVMSGSELHDREALPVPPEDFLAKPIHLDDLLALIDRKLSPARRAVAG
jgi:CheY-like chemotaxis protein